MCSYCVHNSMIVVMYSQFKMNTNPTFKLRIHKNLILSSNISHMKEIEKRLGNFCHIKKTT